MRLAALLLAVFFKTVVSYAQDDREYKRLSQMANTYFAKKDYKRSAETLENAIAMKGDKSGYVEVYNAACAWARAGYPDKAFKHLDHLAGTLMTDPEGYMGKKHVDPLMYIGEKDLASLQTDPRWNVFITRLQKRKRPIENMLDSILLNDQRGRNKIDEVRKTYGATSKEMEELWKNIELQDSINLAKVKIIIDTRGWLGEDSIGERGNRTLFLVIQHADQATQEHYLPIMREAVKDKRAKGSSLAMLEDRVALAQGKKQIYGTQVSRIGDGKWFLSPLENPDSVDIRRKEVGLGRLYFYLRNFDINWDVEAYKKQLSEIEKKEEK